VGESNPLRRDSGPSWGDGGGQRTNLQLDPFVR
jgi:hypothetical protein